MTENNGHALQAELLEVQRTLGWMDLVIAHITDAVYVVDDQSKLIFVNQYFADIIGTPRVFLLGKEIESVFQTRAVADPDKQFKANEPALEAYREALVTLQEWTTADTTRIFKVSNQFIDTIKQTVYIAKDITTEYEVSIMKNSFINIASHQLRTPMTAIMTYAHMLHDGYGGDLNPAQLKLSDRIVSSSERMITLVNDILLISRLQNGEETLQRHDGTLGDVFTALETELRPKVLEQRLVFTMHYSAKIAAVKCSKFLIHEVLANVLANAVQYTPANGLVTLKATIVAGKVKISITDTGIGIPSDFLPKIFNQFTRAENAFSIFNEGTGLGLYVVKIIADLLKGTVQCTSKIDAGTKFLVIIPV